MNNPQLLGLQNGEKFGLIAFKNCDSDLEDRQDLPYGTTVLTELPPLLDNTWKSWLGEIAVGHLKDCNLVLLKRRASAKPHILDEGHEKLGKQLNSLFWLLHLCGVPRYRNAFFMLGSVIDGQISVRQYSEVTRVYRNRGARRAPVSIDQLQEAAELSEVSLRKLGGRVDFSRVKRGLRAVWKALRSEFGEDRLHECVRAIEALILPEVGKTKKQFVSRCQTFTRRDPLTRSLLAEVFDMRSDVEHMHQWERSLGSCSAGKRDSVAWKRTRQVEQLACFVYRKVLLEPTLRSWFKTDAAISKFWTMSEPERQKLWGDGLDLGVVP